MSCFKIIKGTARTYRFLLQAKEGKRALVHARLNTNGKPDMPRSVFYNAHIVYNVDTKQFHVFKQNLEGLSQESMSRLFDDFVKSGLIPEADSIVRTLDTFLPNGVLVGYIEKESGFYIGPVSEAHLINKGKPK